ncbi:hypothetical protein ILUMI_13359 [Ignelater luminosus]|uniref:Uncharacterized protein n=1 Tax=Ignelater luminosus TaxID=2038154 RepID=A0A8K0GBI2_IGNLU|nr:hypothetical protein ILUMI_13359 [Ignelater luminosus]
MWIHAYIIRSLDLFVSRKQSLKMVTKVLLTLLCSTFLCVNCRRPCGGGDVTYQLACVPEYPQVYYPPVYPPYYPSYWPYDNSVRRPSCADNCGPVIIGQGKK